MLKQSYLFALLLILCVGSALADDANQAKASAQDYSINASRDLPILCKDGDIQPFAGKTMGQVFGEAWPTQQEPSNANAHHPAQMLSVRRWSTPRGLEGQQALVVMAVLVDPQGQSIHSEIVCATSAAYFPHAKRTIRSASFAPATVNGTPITSVAIAILKFGPARR